MFEAGQRHIAICLKTFGGKGRQAKASLLLDESCIQQIGTMSLYCIKFFSTVCLYFVLTGSASLMDSNHEASVPKRLGRILGHMPRGIFFKPSPRDLRQHQRT